MKAIKEIEAKISRLSPGLIDELAHFLDHLITKNRIHQPGKLKQNWAGGLKDIKISAIDLQKKTLEWRQK